MLRDAVTTSFSSLLSDFSRLFFFPVLPLSTKPLSSLFLFFLSFYTFCVIFTLTFLRCVFYVLFFLFTFSSTSARCVFLYVVFFFSPRPPPFPSFSFAACIFPSHAPSSRRERSGWGGYGGSIRALPRARQLLVIPLVSRVRWELDGA